MKKYAAIVLAAGLSSRMEGAHKLLLDLKGRTVFEHSLKSICEANFSEVIVVLGKRAEALKPLLNLFPKVKTVLNHDYEQGMTSSIQAGINVSNAEVYAICLADMPLIKSEDYNELIEAFEKLQDGKNILLPLVQGAKGNPVFFSNDYREEILKHQSPNGCNGIVRENEGKVKFFETQNGHFSFDIDTRDDLERLRNAE